MLTNVLDPVDNRGLVYSTNLIVMVLLVVGVLFRWFALGASNPPWAAISVVVLTVGNLIFLFRGGSANIGAWTLVCIFTYGLISAGFSFGAYDGPVLILAPLLPVIAILLIDARAGWIAVVLVSVILSSLFALEVLGGIRKLPNDAEGVLVGRYLAIIFSTLVATWVVWAFSQTVRNLAHQNEMLANTDHLTGIANRRSVEAKLVNETSRVRRSGAWLSVVMVDVDHFKRFNDLNGHLKGDECLVEIANVLSLCARRPTDLVGRYGGEEFILVLPETDPVGAQQIAESIRAGVEAQQVPYQRGRPDVVTVSVGVASDQGHLLERMEDLVKQADDALYGAKAAGRNVVVSHIEQAPVEDKV